VTKGYELKLRLIILKRSFHRTVAAATYAMQRNKRNRTGNAKGRHSEVWTKIHVDKRVIAHYIHIHQGARISRVIYYDFVLNIEELVSRLAIREATAEVVSRGCRHSESRRGGPSL